LVHGITGHNFETRHPNDDSDQVWFSLVLYFQRRRFLKTFTTYDGRRTDGRRRRTPSDGNSSPDPNNNNNFPDIFWNNASICDINICVNYSAIVYRRYLLNLSHIQNHLKYKTKFTCIGLNIHDIIFSNNWRNLTISKYIFMLKLSFFLSKIRF
jgi:hypothetical protein